MRTADGELIPRSKVGKHHTVYVTYSGNIINLDNEGLPIQKGPKPEVLTLQVDAAGDPIHPDATVSDPIPEIEVSAAAHVPSEASSTPVTEPIPEIEVSAAEHVPSEVSNTTGG